MALVLAEHPVKHPNYPNGDHYAVLDTDNGQVGYFTLAEIEKDIKEEDTVFIGNHPLAVKDMRKDNQKGSIIRNTNNGILVYYKNSNCCVIESKNTHNLIKIRYKHFKSGEFKDCLKPSIYGLGIVGFNKIPVLYYSIYNIWRNVILRAKIHTNIYYENWYFDVNMIDSWFYFPNFLDWFLEQPNYIEDILNILSIERTRFELDKDILKKGNRLYSDLTCCLVPESINKSFTYAKKDNMNLPVGLCFTSDRKGVYITHYDKKLVRLLDIDTTKYFNKANMLSNANYYRSIASQYRYINKLPEEQWAAIGYCFLEYKKLKEYVIKQLAEYWYNYEYEGKIYHCITKKCYDALMNWVVDIND